MTLQHLPSYRPGSPEWHEQRRACLGGSEIAAVLGLSPFESRFALWHRKAGLAAPVEDRPEMEWGRRLESAIRRKWLDDHAPGAGHPDGEWVSEVAGERDSRGVFTPATYLRDGWMIASPDWIVQAYDGHELRVIEVKHPLYDDEWGPSGTDQIPVYYLTQARWYLHVLGGLDVCHFAVLIGGCDYREYTVRQDADDVALMVREGRAFLDSIATGSRPDVDGSDATYQVVRRLHPEINDDRVDLDPDLARTLLQATQHAKHAEGVRQAAASQVLDAMGRAKHGDLDGTRIAFRTARTKGDGSPGVPYLQIDRKALHSNPVTERTAS